jgi:hypothetical protein
MNKVAVNWTHWDGRARRMMYPIEAIAKLTIRSQPRFFWRSEAIPVAMMKQAVNAQTGIVRRLVSTVEKPKLFISTGRKLPNDDRLTLEVAKITAF